MEKQWRPQGQNHYGHGNNRGAPPRQNIQNEGKKSIIIHMVGGMFKVNVRRMVRITVVTNVEVVIPGRNVGNQIVVAMDRIKE